MIESMVMNFLFYLVAAVVAAGLARATLLWFDMYLMPPEFRAWLEKCDDRSKVTYYSVRFAAVFFLFATVLG